MHPDGRYPDLFMVGYVIGKDGSRGEAQEAHLDEDPPFVANSLTYVLVFNFQLASGPRQTRERSDFEGKPWSFYPFRPRRL